MTQINHHISEDLMLSYSSGNLPEAFSLVVATHVSLCDECRARLETFDALGGVMIDACGTAEVSDESLEATMALIDEGLIDDSVAPASETAVFPTPLQKYVGGDMEAVKWRAVGGGVRQSVLETSGGATVRLLSIPGGAAMPDHSHGGMELTMVLQGAFSDDDGRFARGDVEIANEELHHTPVAEEGMECICLAATDAPLRFKGLIPRLAQPFIGI